MPASEIFFNFFFFYIYFFKKLVFNGQHNTSYTLQIQIINTVHYNTILYVQSNGVEGG